MKTQLLTLLSITIILFGCDATSDTAKSSTAENEMASDAVEASEGIVNWTALVVREEPSDKGKYLTTVYQGEELQLLGQVQEDTVSGKKNVYTLAELSDGTKGWVLERFIAADASAAAIIEDTEVYKRPDLLTRSDNKFYRMDFVAVKDVNDEWVQVTGVPKGGTWFTEGWIKKDKITEDPTDVSFAVLANRASQEKDEIKRNEEINMLLSSSDFQKSQFFNDYNQSIAEEPEAVEETESEDLSAETEEEEATPEEEI